MIQYTYVLQDSDEQTKIFYCEKPLRQLRAPGSTNIRLYLNSKH